MTSFANGNAKNIKGLGKFKNEKFIGEVAFDEDGDLVDDEVTHLSFYEAEYGGKKIIVGYEQEWGNDSNSDDWVFLNSLDKDGYAIANGEWYGSRDTLKDIQIGLKMKDLQWTEAGMQGDYFITLTRTADGDGWF